MIKDSEISCKRGEEVTWGGGAEEATSWGLSWIRKGFHRRGGAYAYLEKSYTEKEGEFQLEETFSHPTIISDVLFFKSKSF